MVTADTFTTGTIANYVQLGGLHLSLTGPARFIPPNNLLAFDFTQLKVQLFGTKLYAGYIRGGKDREDNFYDQNLSQQAFFTYFFVNEQAIAARGKGGGLALWGREPTNGGNQHPTP